VGLDSDWEDAEHLAEHGDDYEPEGMWDIMGEVKVKSLTGRTVSTRINLKLPLEQLMRNIEQQLGIPIDKQVIVIGDGPHGNTRLEDTQVSMLDHGIDSTTIVHVIPQMRGGGKRARNMKDDDGETVVNKKEMVKKMLTNIKTSIFKVSSEPNTAGDSFMTALLRESEAVLTAMDANPDTWFKLRLTSLPMEQLQSLNTAASSKNPKHLIGNIRTNTFYKEMEAMEVHNQCLKEVRNVFTLLADLGYTLSFANTLGLCDQVSFAQHIINCIVESSKRAGAAANAQPPANGQGA
jgi:hypothetical protein